MNIWWFYYRCQNDGQACRYSVKAKSGPKPQGNRNLAAVAVLSTNGENSTVAAAGVRPTEMRIVVRSTSPNIEASDSKVPVIPFLIGS